MIRVRGNAAPGSHHKVRFRAVLGGATPDVFIDNTGVPEVIQAGYELAGPRGRVILVGVPRKSNNISIHSLPLHFGKLLGGSHGGEAEPAQDIPRYLALFRSGKLMLRGLITECIGLDEINDAIARMRDGTLNGRCLIRF